MLGGLRVILVKYDNHLPEAYAINTWRSFFNVLVNPSSVVVSYSITSLCLLAVLPMLTATAIELNCYGLVHRGWMVLDVYSTHRLSGSR